MWMAPNTIMTYVYFYEISLTDTIQSIKTCHLVRYILITLMDISSKYICESCPSKKKQVHNSNLLCKSGENRIKKCSIFCIGN